MPESTGYAVKNNAESTVADNPLTSSATTLNVAAGQGSRFPSAFPFLITIWDDVTHPDPTDDPNMEITECTARSSDALTIVRGKEDTSGVEHANGSRVAMLITAGIFNDPTYGISTKLNGIEDNATADQTGAEIKTAYESEPNAFTDTKNTKLDGIEDNATADQTKADIDALGIDHGALDGLADDDHTQYLLASGARVMSGDLDIGNNEILHCNRITAGDNEQLNMYGGDPYGSAVAVQPYNAAMYPGQILFVVPNAAHDAHRIPMLIDGNTDTPVVDIYYGLDMGSNKITSVADPVNAQDAATKAWCDANFSGGGVTDHGDLTGLADDDHTQYLLASGARVMAGNLNMGGNGITNCPSLYAVGTDSYADIRGGSAYPARVIAYGEGAGHPGQVRLYVPNAAKNDWLAGLIVTGVSDAPTVTIPYGLNMGSKNITSVADPSATQDAATKNYCDTNFNNYSHPSTIQCNANNYSHPSGRVCSSGLWNATAISGVMPVDHGGTGVTDDSYDADKVDGCDAGSSNGNVWKVPATGPGSIAAGTDSGFFGMGPGTDGYQLTCHGDWTALTWSASSDLIFSDTHCPKCGKKFEDGDNLILCVVGRNEIGDTLTIPMHKECTEASKKTVTIKRNAMEDQYIFDEFTGEPRVQRVRKMQKKIVTKKRMKKDVELDHKTGEFWQLEDEKRKKKVTAADATEEYKEEIDEQIYEDVEFEI